VRAGLREGDAPFVEKPHQVLARHIQQIRCLLRGQLRPQGHDRERVTACQDFGCYFEQTEDRFGNSRPFAIRSDELAMGVLTPARQLEEYGRERRDRSLLARRCSDGLHSAGRLLVCRCHGYELVAIRLKRNKATEQASAVRVSGICRWELASGTGPVPLKAAASRRCLILLYYLNGLRRIARVSRHESRQRSVVSELKLLQPSARPESALPSALSGRAPGGLACPR